MDFESWVKEVRRIVAIQRKDLNPEDVDPNAMYQAFAIGVLPATFANAVKKPVVPLPNPASSIEAPPTITPAIRLAPKSPAVPPPLTNPTPINRPGPGLKVAPPVSGLRGAWRNFLDIHPNRIALVICILVIVAGGVIINAINQPPASSNPDLSGQRKFEALSSHPNSNLIPKPLSDQEKLEKARQMLASWNGSDSVYEAANSSLDEIPASSKLQAKAKVLRHKWANRKAESERNKAKQARIEANERQGASRKAARDALNAEKEASRSLTGDGDTQVAIVKVELHHSTEEHVAGKYGTFVYVFVVVKNVGTEMIHANPNDFTLADTAGYTVSHDQDTYGLSHYFDAVDLSPGQETSGWVIFSTIKDKRYTLTRNGGLSGSTVTKDVFP